MLKPVLTAGDVSSDSVKLNWEAVANADNYEIEINGEVADSTSDASYTANGLVANETYIFRVRAVKSQIRVNGVMISVNTLLPTPENLVVNQYGLSAVLHGLVMRYVQVMKYIEMM